MDKKGTSFFLVLMMAIIFFILGVALAQPLSETVQESRTTSELNCSNSSIGSVKKASCVITDLYAPYFIGVIFGLAGAVLGAKII